MAYNKVEANGETLIDLTSDTVTADTLVSGRTAHLASGEKVTGTFEPVTGVKGNAESTYRKGDVNLTPANLGLGNVDNTSDANKPISTATQAALDAKQAQIDDNSEISETPDTIPYIYKASEHDAVYDELVGGSVAWNQLVANSGSSLSVTITSGHKYVMKKSGTLSVGASSGSAITGFTGGTDWITDLTLMFGTTIADYVYSLEQSTAGSGIAWLKSYGFFTKDYYAYNAGGMVSVNTSEKKIVGKNLFKITSDNSVDNGITFIANKAEGTVTINGTASGTAIYQVGQFTFDAGVSYFFSGGISNGIYLRPEGRTDVDSKGNQVVITEATKITRKIYAIVSFGAMASNLVFKPMIRRADVTDSTFEPYTSLTYPIQSTDLRGLYKLNGNKLYTDGDIYSADGQITRKYGYRDYQSGDESRANAITDGTHTIFKLSAPTTATAQPFASPQMVYRNGTEEYLDTRDVPMPVGGNRKYVDIPDWMVNEYFDDVRAETSTLLVKIENINNGINEIESDMRGVTQDLNDLSGELDCLTIQAALVNNEVVIQNTSDFTDDLYGKYYSETEPKFAILELHITSNTYYYKALINCSSVSQATVMEASFITVNGEYMSIYNFKWNLSGTVGTPTVTRKALNLGS